MKNWKIIVFTLVLAAALFNCSRRESITVAGSTTVLPVVSKAAERFQVEYGIPVIVNAGGSGVGINQLGGGKIDIGMASREMTESEFARYPAVKFVRHPIGKDAVVPVVSSEVYDAGVQVLSLEQIGMIYRGQISNWSELGGPDKEILVVDKEKSRGTRHVFMKSVLGDREAEAPGADLVLGSNNEEQTAIAQSDAAIGMLSNAWINDDVKGLSIRMADQSVVAPTRANIVSGKFPITRELLLLTNGKPQGNIKRFIDFILSGDGQKIVEEAGYVSLRQ